MLDKPESHPSKYWRNMANQARTLADGLVTEVNRQQMLGLAETYDRLAEQAEREQKRAFARSWTSPSRSRAS